ncbi:MAG: FadR/GntR family transcriptional regulator [Syntrophomonadaceae bacterium]|nr:FadR/GntR family transcriptional regulator [Syntrophomonadaceae bacterium]
MSFQPIKTKKIYEEIMEQLKDMISSGELKPGEKLPSEREMSDSLGVSRASVREALTALEALGILEIRPGEGTFVRETSVSRIFEPLAMVLAVERNPGVQMMEVRRILETEAAALAAMRASEEHLKNIDEILDKMKNSDRIPEAVDYDLKFHYSIAEASQNTILVRMMNTVADLMHHAFRSNREKFYADPVKGQRTIHEHEAIAAAIRARNPGLAREKMLEHINHIEADIEHGLNYQKVD